MRLLARIERDYDARNLKAAQRILEHVDQYGGITAFPAVWARLFIERHQQRGHEAAEHSSSDADAA